MMSSLRMPSPPFGFHLLELDHEHSTRRLPEIGCGRAHVTACLALSNQFLIREFAEAGSKGLDIDVVVRELG